MARRQRSESIESDSLPTRVLRKASVVTDILADLSVTERKQWPSSTSRRVLGPGAVGPENLADDTKALLAQGRHVTVNVPAQTWDGRLDFGSSIREAGWSDFAPLSGNSDEFVIPVARTYDLHVDLDTDEVDGVTLWVEVDGETREPTTTLDVHDTVGWDFPLGPLGEGATVTVHTDTALEVSGGTVVLQSVDRQVAETQEPPCEWSPYVVPVEDSDAMSASAVMLDDGRVLYAWRDPSDGQTWQGHAPDLATFTGEDDSVTPDRTLNLAGDDWQRLCLSRAGGRLWLAAFGRTLEGSDFVWRLQLYDSDDEGESWDLVQTLDTFDQGDSTTGSGSGTKGAGQVMETSTGTLLWVGAWPRAASSSIARFPVAIYRSTDGGDTWTSVHKETAISRNPGRTIVEDDEGRLVTYGSTEGSTDSITRYLSTDDGASWDDSHVGGTIAHHSTPTLAPWEGQDSDGWVYAGTSEDSASIRVGTEADPRDFASPLDEEVWPHDPIGDGSPETAYPLFARLDGDLAFLVRGRVYAGGTC